VNNSALLDGVKHWLGVGWDIKKQEWVSLSRLALRWTRPAMCKMTYSEPMMIPDHGKVYEELMAFVIGLQRRARRIDQLGKTDVIRSLPIWRN